MYNLLLENKSKLLLSLTFITLPCLSWKLLYDYYKKVKRDYDEKSLNLERHNCTVMYNLKKGMSGWPPHKNRITSNLSGDHEIFYEPIVYFIDTAKTCLDLAVMNLEVNQILDALRRAALRGVKVRVIVDYNNTNKNLNYETLADAGVNLLLYLSKITNFGSIMHYKYMVKDYDGEDGCVCVGSVNYTVSSFFHNFEDLVFLSDGSLTTAFRNNFERIWNQIENNNKDVKHVVHVSR